MKKYILITVVFLIYGCSTLTSKETNIAVTQILDEIQIAINEINKQTQRTSLPPFKNAEVVLSSKAGTTKEGSAALILSAEGKKSTNESNTLTLILAPKSAQEKSLVEGTGKKLAEYVVAAVKAIDTKNDLELQKLIVEATFSVERDKAGGIKIEVASIEFGGKTYASSSNRHKLKLVFEKKPNKKI